MNRPARPTIEEVRAVAQPPEVRSRKNAEHWTAELYLRHISIYLTVLLVRTPITANGVTGLMILSGWAIGFSLLIPGIWGALLALFFSQLQLYFDCCDGEVARWRGTRSAKGVFLDAVGHYTTEGFVAFMFGVRAVGDLGLLKTEPGSVYPYLVAGGVLASLVLLNKALNSLVHMARAFNGLDKLPDTAEATAVTAGGLAALKRAARFVPFHRIWHSVEMSMIAVVLAVISLLVTTVGGPELSAERWAVLVMVPLCALSVIGHFMSIWFSRRLG